jgi:hypothetical protein
MSLVKAEDHGLGDEVIETCVYCTNEDGTVKSATEIFNGGVDFFVQSAGVERDFAERIVRKNMVENCPYWQERDEEILKGEKATNEEFAEVMAGIS